MGHHIRLSHRPCEMPSGYQTKWAGQEQGRKQERTTRAAQVDSARDPNRSDPMPAMSPTLSPTLSAPEERLSEYAIPKIRLQTSVFVQEYFQQNLDRTGFVQRTGDHSGIAGIVLGNVLLDLANQVSTDVSSLHVNKCQSVLKCDGLVPSDRASCYTCRWKATLAADLGVDAATDATKQRNGGASQTEAGDGLVQAGPVVAVEVAEDAQGHEQSADTHGGKQEPHDRTGAERCVPTAAAVSRQPALPPRRMPEPCYVASRCTSGRAARASIECYDATQ